MGSSSQRRSRIPRHEQAEGRQRMPLAQRISRAAPITEA
jgi:hypothetical protein